MTHAALERLMRRSGPKQNGGLELIGGSPPDEAMLDLAGQNWLVFADAGGVADAFAAKMRAAGASIVLIPRPDVMDEKHVPQQSPRRRRSTGRCTALPCVGARCAGFVRRCRCAGRRSNER